MNISLTAVIGLIGLTVFGLLLLPASLRWRLQEPAIRILSLFLAAGVLQNLGSAITALTISLPPSQQLFFYWLSIGAGMAIPLIFGGLTLVFLGHTQWLSRYLIFAAIMFAMWVVVKTNFYGATTILLPYLPLTTTPQTPAYWLSIISWGSSIIISLISLHQAMKTKQQAQYRNRYRYWLITIILLITANTLFSLAIAPVIPLAQALTIIAALITTYVVLWYHPPDLRIVVSHLVRNFTVTLLTGLLLFAALNTAYLMNTWQFSPQQVIMGLIIMSLAGGFILPYLSQWVKTSLNRVLFGDEPDQTTLLKSYTAQIKNDWDYNRLTHHALDFLLREIGSEYGILFNSTGDNTGRITLLPVAVSNTPKPPTKYFDNSNPWIISLREQHLPVTQYDLDVLPTFQKMSTQDKIWLETLQADLFVPMVLRQRDLVGVIALGHKPNHHPFSVTDLTRLQILADQIALDMDKARLFGHLGDVNQKLGDMMSRFETFDKGKTDFLSIASHELRTPLTHIYGYASMLTEAGKDDIQDPAYLQNIFNGIASGSNRLKQVVDLIFDVSRAEIGELDIAPVTISLAEAVKQSTQSQQDAIEERGHTLIVSGIDQLPPIQADLPRLVQALSHLLNNAIKYTPDGGTITITGRTTTENNAPAIELIFTDTGIGIDAKNHAPIFEKFYRVGDVEHHSTSSVRFKGAGPGLGLPLVAGIARAHGGRVWVESPEYNEQTCPGSQFHLVLPVSPPETKPEPTPNTSSKAETRRWTGADLKLIQEKLEQKKSS